MMTVSLSFPFSFSPILNSVFNLTGLIFSQKLSCCCCTVSLKNDWLESKAKFTEQERDRKHRLRGRWWGRGKKGTTEEKNNINTGGAGGWYWGDGGGRRQSSLSEDIYILQSAPWIRIVEFPLIKEEGNVFTIKLDAQNEWLGEAWACCSLQLSAFSSLMKQPKRRGSPRIEICFLSMYLEHFLTLISPRMKMWLSIVHCVVIWPLDTWPFDIWLLLYFFFVQLTNLRLL